METHGRAYVQRLLAAGVADGFLAVNDMGYHYPIEKAIPKRSLRRYTELIWRLSRYGGDYVLLDRFDCPMWKCE